MEFDFSCDGMKGLYTGDPPIPMPVILNDDIVHNYVLVVAAIDGARTINDVSRRDNSLNFEYMEGTRKKRGGFVQAEYSMRLTGKWRVIVYIAWTNKDCSIGHVTFEYISKHYAKSYSKTERWP